MESSLAERFWSVARDFDEDLTLTGEGHPDPVGVVRHVLSVLDAFDAGAKGHGVTVNTRSFLLLLRQSELAGDLLYASPEQARGETMDERSLVFSVGVLLFEKLTGRHPFGAEGNPRRVARIQKGQMGSGVNYFPIIPPGLRQILMRAMGPFAEERWSSIDELRLRLEAFVAAETGANVPARERSVQVLPILPTTRRPLITIAPTTSPRREDDSRTFSEAVTKVARRPSGLADATPAEGTPAVQVAAAPPPAPATVARGPLFGPAAPMVWTALGALIATAMFVVYTRVAAPAAAAAIAAPAAAPAAAPVAPAVAPPGPEAAPAERPAPAPAAPAPAAAVAAAPTTATFDARTVGTAALARARVCFGDGDAGFGLGLLFVPGDPAAKRAYFSPDDGLTPEQRRCVRDAMVGVAAGAAPPDNVIVEYAFRIHGGELEVKVRK